MISLQFDPKKFFKSKISSERNPSRNQHLDIPGNNFKTFGMCRIFISYPADSIFPLFALVIRAIVFSQVPVGTRAASCSSCGRERGDGFV